MASFILITGASSGFGAATAKLFAAKGYGLVLMARRKDKLDALVQELPENIEAHVLAADVRDEEVVTNAINSLPKYVKTALSILVNNAGLAVGKGPIDKGFIEDWDRMVDTNVKGLLYVSRAVIPLLKANKKGHIINVASIAGKEVYPGGNVYCATKHAVDALSRAMRIDLVNDNIKVSNLAPGAAETEFSIVRFKGNEAQAKSIYDGYDPLVAQDIAETIWFMCSRPDHVNVNDITLMATAQASAAVFAEKE
ncbi:MAG: NAD(P)-dependent oxidoreductase [Crocinitomicaceae bacterium TMED16]|nr:MAG: NAD(P)-dependent oxidoreductase [Crocinitomicaceae bacterium TMED16]|tara:strand:+ start:485 stop:1243 length:759 start_codon:yes stop_codon:yes gene_type:complete